MPRVASAKVPADDQIHKAETNYDKAAALLQQAVGEDHPYYAANLCGRARLSMIHGRDDVAETLLLRAIAVFDRCHVRDDRFVETLKSYADLLRRAHRTADVQEIEKRMAECSQ
jgi:hypothetical protein